MCMDNKDYPIIDFHAHIYPAKIAEKATRVIGEFYDAPMAWHGFSDELLKSGSQIGVAHYVVHSTATKPEQVESINNFIINETQIHPEFIGFGTMHPGFAHPDFSAAVTELDRIKNAGLKGIKLHPDFQKFEIDTPQMDDVYDWLSNAGMPVLVHAGDCRYDFSGPKRIAHVLDKHPHLKVVAAHFGGYTEWDASFEYLAGRDVWFDTSSTLWKLPIENACRMMVKHGISRFLFGSDFPMWDHSDEMTRFNKLKLSEKDRRAVLYGNACQLLGLHDK